MKPVEKEKALIVLETLFDKDTFVSSIKMEKVTGLTQAQILSLKAELQDRLRGGDHTISLTSIMNQAFLGFFLDVS